MIECFISFNTISIFIFKENVIRFETTVTILRDLVTIAYDLSSQVHSTLILSTKRVPCDITGLTHLLIDSKSG